MPEEKIPYTEFAKTIKQKYPDYKDVDDKILAEKMVEKYPEYKDRVVFETEPLKKKAGSTPSPLLSADGTSGSVPGASEQSGLNYLAGDLGGVAQSSTPQPVPQDLPLNRVSPIEAPVTILPTTMGDSQSQQPLRAATTSLETTAKDQQDFNPNLPVEKPSAVGSALTSGVLKAGSLLLQSPTFVYDAIAATTNKIINKPLGIPDAPMWSQLGNTEDSYYKTMIEELESASQSMNENFQKVGDTDVFEDLKKGDYKKGAEKAGLMALQSLPTTMAIMAATLMNPTAAAGLSASAFAADKKRELDKALPDMPEEEKVGWAALSGGLESAFEQMGLTKLGPMIAKTVKGASKKVVLEEAKDVVSKTYGKTIKRYLGIKSEEVLSEMSNTVAQNLIAITSGEDKERKWNDGVMTSGIVAAISAGGIGTPAMVGDLVVTRQAKDQAKKLMEEKSALTKDLQNDNVPDPVKDVISKKIGDINEKEADIAIKEKEQFEALSEDGQKKVVDLSVKAAELEQSLNSNIGSPSQETQDLIKKELEDVDKQISEIYKGPENKAKEKDELVEVQAEATVDKAVAPEAKVPEVEKVELPPVRQGGLVRLYEKDKGTWKQNVGGELTEISPGMKETVQKAYDATRQEAEKKAIEESFNATSKEEQDLATQEYETEQQLREEYNKKFNPSAETKTDSGTERGKGPRPRGRNRRYDSLPEETKTQLTETVKGYKDKFSKELELPDDPETEVNLDENVSSKIAEAYEAMPSDDSKNPEVIEAYNALKEEVQNQYDYMVNDLGIKVEFIEGDPYKNSGEMLDDVVNNKHLFVYKGGEDHPLMGSSTADENGVTANEKFRAVHDYFGHAVDGSQFGKHGEESAWVAHSKMFSKKARRALTTETRGQNSWVNFSGTNKKAIEKIKEGNRLIKEGKTEEGNKLIEEGKSEFKFAEQKVALLPEEFSDYTIYEKGKKSDSGDTTPPSEPPVPPTGNKQEQPNISGGKKKRTQTKRMEANDPKYKAILGEMSDSGKYYTAVEEKKVEEYINDLVDKVEKAGKLENLAKDIIDGNSPFVPEAANAGAAEVGNRLRLIAEKEGNEMQRKEVERVAAELFSVRAENVRIAATQTAMENIVAKSIPITEAGLTEHFQAVMTQSQNTYLSEQQKKGIKSTQEAMDELMSTEEGMKKFQEAVEEEVNRMAEATKGKDWVKKVDDELDSLKIKNIKDC